MSKKLKIPEYWYTDERLQPLVEAKTINGNKVMIPQLLKRRWKAMESSVEDMLANPDTMEKLHRGCQEDDSFRRQISIDLGRLFFEIGQD